MHKIDEIKKNFGAKEFVGIMNGYKQFTEYSLGIKKTEN